MFEVLSKNFNQNIVPISKSIPMSARHIPSLLRSISHFNFKVQTVHAINGKDGQIGHPYEDFLCTDSENGVYVVADGITRKEGFNGEKTTASMISSTFSEVMVQTLAESLNGQSNDIAEVIRDSLTESRNLTFENRMAIQNINPSWIGRRGRPRKKASGTNPRVVWHRYS